MNLVVVGGVIDPEDTGDREERDECVKMHQMIKDYKLQVGGGTVGAWGQAADGFALPASFSAVGWSAAQWGGFFQVAPQVLGILAFCRGILQIVCACCLPWR